MAKEILNLEVKSNIKAVAKDQKEWNKELKKTEESIKDVNEEGKEVVAEMQILGISLNGIKAGFKSLASGAKFMFRSIKMGIASTGIGLLVIAFATLSTWFTSTKKGAEVLSVAFKGIGAAINVIVDRIAKFGEGIAKILSGEVRSGLKDMGNSFKGIGAEIFQETLFVMALEKSLQRLTDSQRLLNVETAQRRADIEELKLIAEDVTKSEKERLDAAKKAFGIETDLLERRIANAEESVRIEKLRLSTVLDPEAEQLDVLAQKEIDLANIRGESVTKQIELNNKINAIEAETEAKRLAAHDIRMKQIQDEKDAKLKAAKEQEDAEVKRADGWEKRAKKEMAIAKAVEDYKLATISRGLGAAAALAGENVTLSKGVAAAQTIFQTQQGIMAAMGATSVGDKLLPYPLRLANAIATGVMGAAALSKIMSTNPSGAVAGGGGISAAAAPPAPQMMSGSFDLTGGQAVEPTRAYVVSDDITNSQNGLEIIRRRATI